MSYTYPMTPSKRKHVENWLSKVDKYLEENGMCTHVISIIDHDPNDTEAVARPLDNVTSGDGERPKSRRELKTPDPKSEVYRNTTLPNVKYKSSYAEELKRKSRQLLEGMNVLRGADQARNMNVSGEEMYPYRGAALVIVDPQLITPTTDLNNIPQITRQRTKVEERVKVEEKEDVIPKYETLKGNMEARRLTKQEIFARCKIQSQDKDSFVVSRSNVKIKNTDKKQITNHSFLTLPLRFQLDTHRKRILTRDRVNNIPGNVQDHTETPRRRMEASNPKLLQSAVWAW